jgi:hypothetical protein
MNVPAIDHKSLKKPRERVERIEREIAKCIHAGEVAGAKISAAEAHDREARRDAKYRGLPVPERTAPDRDAAEKAAREEHQDLKENLARAFKELDAARAANQPALLAELDKKYADANEQYHGLLVALRGVNTTLETLEGQKGYVKHGPGKNGSDAWSPAVPGDGGEGRTRVGALIDALEAREIGLKPTRSGLMGQRLHFRDTQQEPQPLMETLT